jgi:hypothetical protein
MLQTGQGSSPQHVLCPDGGYAIPLGSTEGRASGFQRRCTGSTPQSFVKEEFKWGETAAV